MSVETGISVGALLSVRLEGLRRRARKALLLFGCSCLLLAVAAGAIGAVVMDYLLHFPAALRVAVLVAAIGAWVYVAWRFVWRAARLTMSEELLAQRVERQFPAFGDRLVSAVSFAPGPAVGESEAMTRAVTDEAKRIADGLPLEQSVNWSPARHALLASVLVAGLVGGIAAWQSELASLGLARYARPYSAAPWPKTVGIDAMTGDLTIPLGESAGVRMAVVRGVDEGLRGWVVATDSRGESQRLLMQQVSPGQYAYTFDALTESLRYHFEAGDDNSADAPGRITIVNRPAVLAAQVRFTPPPYVKDGKERVVRLGAGVARAAIGSAAVVEIETTKPIGADADGGPDAWMLVGRRRAAMKWKDDSRRRLAGEFALRDSTYLQVHLRDELGLDNRGRTPYRFEAVVDTTPVVSIVEPRGTLEVTPDASVPVVVSAEDDWGIADLWIDAEVQNTPKKRRVDLAGLMRFAAPDSDTRARAEVLWNIADLKPEAGDVIAYRARATDNFELDGERHAAGESPVMRLQVVDPKKLAERLRETFRLLRQKIGQLLAEQRDIKDETDAVSSDLSQSGQLTQADREALRSLSSRQNQLGTRTRNLSRQFEQTARRMQDNRIEDPEGLRRLETVGEGLKDLAGRTMRGAAEQMRRAGQSQEPDRQREQLAGSAAQQQESVESLRGFMELMDRWGNFQQIVRKVREMLERQRELRNDARRIGAKTLGKSPDALSKSQRGGLNRVGHAQEDLRGEMRELNDRMRGLSDSLKQSDPASSKALRGAARAADSAQVARQMARAVAAVGENRIGEARNAQQQAETGLRNMLDELSGRGARELDELDKMLREGERALEDLLERQKRQLAANRSARAAGAGPEKWKQLGREQDQIKRNAQDLAGQLDKIGARKSSQNVRQAAGKMSRASARLSAEQGERAEADQQQAAEDLRRALDELRKLRREAEGKNAERRLSAIRESLAKIRVDQDKINGQTDQYEQLRAARGQLPRAAVVRIGKLAKRQMELEGQTRKVGERLVPAEVFVSIADEVADGMATSGEALAARFTNEETRSGQARVLRRLDQLLEALKRDKRKEQEDGFASQPAGGKGQSGKSGSMLPPATQLKLLKILQADVNERTRRLDEARARSGKPDEKSLTRLRELGHEQRGIAEMTGKLMRPPGAEHVAPER